MLAGAHRQAAEDIKFIPGLLLEEGVAFYETIENEPGDSRMV